MENDRDRQPGLASGLLTGLLLTAALIAVFYAADALVGTPFVPFDVLDWLARNLPGDVITFAIDRMVGLITALGVSNLDVAAKTAEQLMGILGLLITGTAAAGLFFRLMNRLPATPRGLRPGFALGAALGVPAAALSLAVNFTAATEPAVSAVWIVLTFMIWGAAVQWVYTRLAAIRPQRAAAVSAQGIDRRNFLIRVGGATAAITVVGAGLGALFGREEAAADSAATIDDVSGPAPARADLPNANAAVQPVPGTRPELTPVAEHYRIDISSRPPVIDEATYTLPVFGLVDQPLSLTLEQIRTQYEAMHQYITLSCISNPIAGELIGTQKWTGVPLKTLLAEAGLQANARYLRIYGADSFDETVDIDLVMQDERIMLTYAWDDAPLPVRNGFPLRIYIPDRYGMKQPKWITEIEVVAEYEDGYWVRRGWDKDALMMATSVIDVVAVNEAYEQDGTTYIPIGGIAHAGDRSIARVEVKVDDGEWTEAQLREPLSDKTWVIWRYEWPFSEGRHRFAVRCVDGAGTPQIIESRGVRPSGATGIHSVNETVML
jgi:DMSO/TMAO reductase YedYZ molybdopterin-dependent catalytic subunit